MTLNEVIEVKKQLMEKAGSYICWCSIDEYGQDEHDTRYDYLALSQDKDISGIDELKNMCVDDLQHLEKLMLRDQMESFGLTSRGLLLSSSFSDGSDISFYETGVFNGIEWTVTRRI